LIVANVDETAVIDVLSLVINLAWHYLILIPYISQLIEKADLPTGLYAEQLNKIILEGITQFSPTNKCFFVTKIFIFFQCAHSNNPKSHKKEHFRNIELFCFSMIKVNKIYIT
jgi:hypothetical protein